MKNQIRHSGTIVEIANGLVRVRITQTSACAGCKVASKCHTAEAKEKIVDVALKNERGRWQVGQEVTVSTSVSMAGRALTVAFGLPLLLMLIVLVCTLWAGCSEGLAAVLMLASLVPYYLVVWLCRDRIAQTIAFRLEE